VGPTGQAMAAVGAGARVEVGGQAMAAVGGTGADAKEATWVQRMAAGGLEVVDAVVVRTVAMDHMVAVEEMDKEEALVGERWVDLDKLLATTERVV